MIVIFFSVIIALAFLLLSIILKGIAAVVEATIEMLDVLSVFLIGGAVILILDILVDLFCGKFWQTLLIIVAIGVVLYLGGVFLAAIIGIVAEILLVICSAIYTFLEWLGNKCEMGLMHFLGIINKKVSVS